MYTLIKYICHFWSTYGTWLKIRIPVEQEGPQYTACVYLADCEDLPQTVQTLIAKDHVASRRIGQPGLDWLNPDFTSEQINAVKYLTEHFHF